MAETDPGLLLGCPLNEILREIQGTSSPTGPRSRGVGEPLSGHAVATIWKWLVARRDVSVGKDNEHDHLPLEDILVLASRLSRNAKQDKATATSPTHETSDKNVVFSSPIKLFVSEDTMWEAITGHSVNYKRVPRSEWLLLLGIASTKSEGILQGDLGRLVDQDKRSVPKRTDALVKKGYIIKRTTLVRGTKTSKLWIKSFAPPLPKESDATPVTSEMEMNLSQQILTADLESVAWHSRWTGESMDFPALATTIMAVAKAWHVIRLQDLKAKLGVLGMRWQMKIVSKICRFLNSCGAIQYVAAKLDDRVFKDCIKYVKDLNNKDWSAFLATGKRAARPLKSALTGIGDNNPELDGQPDVTRVNGARLSRTPPWIIDNPLPQKIARSVQSFGPAGLTNPEIYALTLGPSFNRYISSLTGCLTASQVQPEALSYLQLKSEHIRVGKVASYRYSAPQLPVASPPMAQLGESLEELPHAAAASKIYGFQLHNIAPKFATTRATLSKICGLSDLTPRASQGQPKRRGRPKKTQAEQDVQAALSSSPERPIQQRKSAAQEEDLEAIAKETSIDGRRLVTVKLSSNALRNALDFTVPTDEPTEASTGTRESTVKDEAIRGAEVMDWSNSLDSTRPREATTPGTSRGRGGRGRGRGSGRGRGRPPHSSSTGETSGSRSWTCSTCGGSWKNDIGLKYHLEKSRTTCNPLYDPTLHGSSRRGRKPAFLKFRTQETADEDPAVEEAEEATPTPRQGRSRSKSRLLQDGAEATGPEPLETRFNGDTAADSTPALSLEDEPSRLALKSRKKPASYSSPNTQQGLLLSAGTSQPCHVPVLQKQHHRPLSSNHGGHEASSSTQRGSASHPTATVPEAVAANRNVEPGADVVAPEDISPTYEFNLDDLVETTLQEHGGALLGGQSLAELMLSKWDASRFGRQAPDKSECDVSAGNLVKKGRVAEHWHAFRDSTGAFSKCHLITLPGMDAFSPESTQLLQAAKAYLHTTPSSSATGAKFKQGGNKASESRVGGRRRRMLAKEVAVLHAPVYAAQVAAKRQETTYYASVRSKRRRTSFSSEFQDDGDNSLQYSSANRNTIRWASDRRGESWFTDLGRRQQQVSDTPRVQSASHVRFLQPNSFLYNEPPRATLSGGLPSSSLRPPTPDSEDQLQQAATATTATVAPEHRSRREFSFRPIKTISGKRGTWPCLDVRHFENLDKSFTMSGWMPGTQWFEWSTFLYDSDQHQDTMGQNPVYVDNDDGEHKQFMARLRTCMKLELEWEDSVINDSLGYGGSHSKFVRFSGGPRAAASQFNELTWPTEAQLTRESNQVAASVDGDDEHISSSDEEWIHPSPRGEHDLREDNLGEAGSRDIGRSTRTPKAKRTLLVTRMLTPLPAPDDRSDRQRHDASNDDDDDDDLDTPEHVIAGFVAVRTILGGTDKAVDWGMMLRIFPNRKLVQLRRLWTDSLKYRAAYIANYTRAFQERFIAAIENDEISMPDFDRPEEYDWTELIHWTMNIPHQEGFQLPRSRHQLTDCFRLQDAKDATEDWRERFYHVQSSVFTRFESVTSNPGALKVGMTSAKNTYPKTISDLDVAKSWIKSLCSMSESEHSVEQIRDKFLTLGANRQRNSALLRDSIELLTQQKIICRSKKPPLGGRPYRLNEGYIAALSKMAQTAKFRAAASFKARLDACFRRHEKLKVPYTISDGAMMALTNLTAAGRVKLTPTKLPDIPFGFEPGNYESRKLPKSSYYFELEVVPTEHYLYNEQIPLLKAAVNTLPPRGGSRGELPQWIDFFGRPNTHRWSEILGAFCFAIATRGCMDLGGICSALSPILDEFEAHLIVAWGKKVGILTGFADDLVSTVGEWWWLAVPALRQWQRGAYHNHQQRE